MPPLLRPVVFSEVTTFVEEMVSSNFWPLGKFRLEMKLVKMKLPVFNSEEGEFVPYFNLERAKEE